MDPHLCLPLAQYRCSTDWRRSTSTDTVFRGLGVTTGMIDLISNPHSVHPDPLLRFIVPYRFEFFLINRTNDIGHCRIIRYRDPRPLSFPRHGVITGRNPCFIRHVCICILIIVS